MESEQKLNDRNVEFYDILVHIIYTYDVKYYYTTI